MMDSDLEEKIEYLEKKVEELEKQNKELQKKVAEEKSESRENKENEISRRGFLKGLGALGVGALAMSSPVASQMKITSNTIEKDDQSIWQGGLFNTNDYLALSGSNSMNDDLDLGGNSLTNVTNVDGVNISSHVNSTSNPHSVDVSQLDTYSISQVDSNFASSGHNHDGRYYTQSQVDSNFNNYTNSDAQSAIDGTNPQFGSYIGFNNDDNVIEHDDGNTGTNGSDQIILRGDGKVSNSELEAGYIRSTEAISVAVYQSTSDLPSSLPEGSIAYVSDKGALYVEDGT